MFNRGLCPAAPADPVVTPMNLIPSSAVVNILLCEYIIVVALNINARLINRW